MLDTFIDNINRIRAIAHGRYHRADVCFEKGSLGKFACAACCDIQHFYDWADVLGKGQGRRGRLCSLFQQCKGGVDVQIKRVGHIRCNAAACEPADIGQRVLKAREVMQVL